MEGEHLPILLMNGGSMSMTDVAIERRKFVNDGCSKLNGVVSDMDDGCALTVCFS